MSKEAMKLALENVCSAKLCEINSMSSRHEMIRLMDEAITALREALAEQPAQQEQEPVAKIEITRSKHTGEVDGWAFVERPRNAPAGIYSVYTSPQPAQQESGGPSGHKLSDFQEGQWWLRELDAAVAGGTCDQKRAVAVVRNMLATAQAHLAEQPAQQEQVAWRWSESGGVRWFDWTTDWSHYDRAKAMGFPIQYAVPQAQRKPLTDKEQIAEALRRHGLTLIKTASGYDVLKLGQINAHGIKENT